MSEALVGNWHSVEGVSARRYQCGHCGAGVAADKGWFFVHGSKGNDFARIYICPLCSKPSYFEEKEQMPGVRFGETVEYLPGDVDKLYEQARSCSAAGAYTPAVLACRKLLMHIAVERGATPGRNFVEYVEHLAASGYVPPDGKGWVDYIRKKGNEANHEIALMTRDDAERLLTFAGMLMKFIYEFPKKIPAPPAAAATL